MGQTIIQPMSIIKGSGTPARGQAGVGCTTLMDQFMKESGIMIVVTVMDY